MREIEVSQITDIVEKLCIAANEHLPEDVKCAIRSCRACEDGQIAQGILDNIIENFEIADNECVPICQDTGMAVVYAELGQDAHICGGLLEDAVNEGVRRGYPDGYLPKSVVRDPIRRGNTGDNTPAVLHVRLVAGDRLRLTVAPKGFGSENMSRLCMLTPAQGLEGVKDFVVETARLAGANPCPPMMLGVGVGGTFERVAELARLHGVSMTEIALAWLIHKGAIPVAGATKLSHVEGAARATEQALTEEEVAYLEACYTPHALVGVMAQNTQEAADRPGVWSQSTPKV